MTFVLLVAGVLGYLAFGPSASAANLRYVFSDGETHRYGVSMTFNMDAGTLAFGGGGGSFKGSMEMILSQKTTTVAKDGVATIQYAVEKIRVTEGKNTVDVPAPPTPLTIRMAPDGRVLEAKGPSLLNLGESDPVSDLSGLFGPEAFGPILPSHKVEPGESWTIDEDMANPFGETIHYQGKATLLRRTQIDGQEAAVIQSETNSPYNFRFTFDEIAKLAGTSAPRGFGDAAMVFSGYFGGNFTQSLTTKSGFLHSAIGDFKMTGTLSFDNVPDEAKNISAVFSYTFQVTMTSIP